MTFNQVVSQLGGLFSLWTGVSVVMMVTWISEIAPRLKDIVVKDGGVKVNDKGEEHSDTMIEVRTPTRKQSDGNVTYSENIKRRLQVINMTPSRPGSLKVRIRRAQMSISEEGNLESGKCQSELIGFAFQT